MRTEVLHDRAQELWCVADCEVEHRVLYVQLTQPPAAGISTGIAHCELPPARASFALLTEACRGAQDRPQLDDGPPTASSRSRLEEALQIRAGQLALRRASHPVA